MRQLGDQHPVRGCADQGRETADGSRIGDAKQQVQSEIFSVRGHLAARGQALPVEFLVQEHQRQAHGHHHHRRGGVRQPHRQKAGGDHEAEHKAVGLAANDAQHMQRDAPVQIPFFHRHGDHEAAHEQQNDPIHVLIGDIGEDHVDAAGRNIRAEFHQIRRGHFAAAHDAKQREQHNRQQGRRRQGNRFGDPPDRHQQDDGKHPRRHRIAGVELDKEQGEDKYQRPQQQSYAAVQRDGPAAGGGRRIGGGPRS